MRKERSGFMYIELLIVLAIILFVGYRVWLYYFKKPPLDSGTTKVLSEQGIDASNSQVLLNSTRNKLRAIEEQRRAEEDAGKIAVFPGDASGWISQKPSSC